MAVSAVTTGPVALSQARSRRWPAVGAICLASFLLSLEDTAVSVVLPQIRSEFGLGLNGLEWVVNAYTLSMAVLILPAGRLCDAIGARRVFLVGTAVFTLGGLVAGTAGTGWLLLIARVIQGLGAALTATAALTLVSSLSQGGRRGAALGVWAGVSAMGLGLGPLLGALLTDVLAWPWVFLVNVPLGVLILAVAAGVLPDSDARTHRGRLPVAGLVWSAVALLALLLALTEGQRVGWTSPTVGALLFTLSLAVALWVLGERRGARLIDERLMRSRAFRAANTISLLSTAVMCNLFFFLSLFFQLSLGYSPLETGLSLLPLTVLIVLVAPLAGRASDRFGPALPVACGMALLAVALLALALSETEGGLRAMIGWLALGGVGIGLATTPTTAAALDAAPDGEAGVAAGLINVSRLVGLSIGIATMGAILSAGGVDILATGDGSSERFADGLSLAFVVNAVIATVAAFVAGLSLRRSPTAPAARGVTRTFT